MAGGGRTIFLRKRNVKYNIGLDLASTNCQIKAKKKKEKRKYKKDVTL